MKCLAEEGNIFMMVPPIDMGSGANAGITRVNMTKFRHAEVVIIKDAGQAAEGVVVTLWQTNVGTGGTPKALSIPHGVYVRFATNFEDSTGFVKETRDVAPNPHRYTSTSSIQKEAVITIPVDAVDMDINNGYVWLHANIADTGGAGAVGTCVILTFDSHYEPAPDAAYHA